MEFYNNVLAPFLSTIGISSVLVLILRHYIIEKLKGEIKKDVDKDVERYKGEIRKDVDKDVERYKGEIKKDVDKDVERYKGEIRKDIDKDVERYKGEIRKDVDKDVEKFKGNINKDIEMLKIKEGRADSKSSRYVQIITNQRILWLEKIREDVSGIVSLARIIIFNKELLSQFEQVTMINELVTKNKEFNVSDEYMKKLYEKQEAISKLMQLTSKLKLRLNPTDDKKMIILLSEIEDGLIKKISEKEMTQILDNIIKISQEILKTEWEKVKKEVREGKEEKEILENDTINLVAVTETSE